MSYVLVEFNCESDDGIVLTGCGVMKIALWEDIVEKTQSKLDKACGEIVDVVAFSDFETWNDCFDVKYISDSDAKAAIRVLGKLSNAVGDEDHVFVEYFAQATDLEYDEDDLSDEHDWE